MQVPVPSTPKPKSTSAKSRAITDARVLTSTECLAMIKEKELKKKKEADEKERRKRDREEKKQEKQEQLKKKAEERAKKAEERAKKAEEKARSRKSDGNNESRVGKNSDSDNDYAPRPKRNRIEEEINCNECSVCFGTYQEDVEQETGREWIQCGCGRWAHEVCVIDLDA